MTKKEWYIWLDATKANCISAEYFQGRYAFTDKAKVKRLFKTIAKVIDNFSNLYELPEEEVEDDE